MLYQIPAGTPPIPSHNNAFPSSSVMLGAADDEAGWSSSTSMPEMRGSAGGGTHVCRQKEEKKNNGSVTETRTCLDCVDPTPTRTFTDKLHIIPITSVSNSFFPAHRARTSRIGFHNTSQFVGHLDTRTHTQSTVGYGRTKK